MGWYFKTCYYAIYNLLMVAPCYLQRYETFSKISLLKTLQKQYVHFDLPLQKFSYKLQYLVMIFLIPTFVLPCFWILHFFLNFYKIVWHFLHKLYTEHSFKSVLKVYQILSFITHSTLYPTTACISNPCNITCTYHNTCYCCHSRIK